MLYIGENKYPQLATVWEIEDKGTYAVVKFGTSRKEKESGEYKNSNWSFTRFVGNAYKNIGDLQPKMKIVIKAGGISQEPYMKDGVKTWPKNPQIVVFAWGLPEEREKDTTDDDPQVEDTGDSDELPF